MPFFARFVRRGKDRLRVDTRFYSPEASLDRSLDCCIGSILLCNPGSATGSEEWGQIEADPTLQMIGQILETARKRVVKINPSCRLPSNGFIEILNCCYVCDGSIAPPECRCGIRQKARGPWVWIAWGTNVRAALRKHGAEAVNNRSVFWFSRGELVFGDTDSATAKAVHPDPRPVGWKRWYPNYPDVVSEEIAKRLANIATTFTAQSS